MHPARPSTSTEPDPRQRILDAAEQAFANKGLAGARVAAIAESAGVNKAMLYYYYGNKVALYEAVMQRTIGQVTTLAQATLRDPSTTPAQRLQAFLQGYRQVVLNRPHFVRIMMRELLDGGERIRRLFVPQVAAIWRQALPALAEGRLDGALNPAVHPQFVPMVLISPFITFNAFYNVLQDFTDMDPDQLRTRYLQTAEAILLRGLLVHDPEEPAP